MLHIIFKIALRFVLILLSIVGFLIRPFLVLYGYVYTPKKRLPPFNEALLQIPAVDLAQKIRNQEVTAEAVIRAYVERIQQVNPLINAVVDERFEAAIQDAKAVDLQVVEARARGSIDDLAVSKPLLGIPLTVKESCCVKGMRATQGSKSFANSRATYTGKATELVINAGAIPLLVSNTPEYCYSWESFNLITGRTLNPYDQRRTSGGSSGGEGALLGAGASLIGVGSDLAGSIRVPALYNGVFGHKPTIGYIPVDGHVPYVEDEEILRLIVIGPMVRYSKDLPLLFDIMSEGRLSRSEVPIKDVKIFFKYKMGRGLHTGDMDRSLVRAQKDVVQHFHSQGMAVKEMDLDFNNSLEMSVVHYIKAKTVPDVLYNPENPKSRRSWIWELIKCFFGKANVTFAALYFQLVMDLRKMIPKSIVNHYVDKGDELRESIIDRLQTDGVLLFPTFGGPAPRHYHYYTNMIQVIYTALFNTLNLPSTHVQVGLNADQLPVGFQVVAAPGQDHLCFKVAQAIEEKFGGWRPPAPLD